MFSPVKLAISTAPSVSISTVSATGDSYSLFFFMSVCHLKFVQTCIYQTEYHTLQGAGTESPQKHGKSVRALYNQNIFLLLNIQKMTTMDTPIRIRMITQVQYE